MAKKKREKVLMIHGYNHDPAREKHSPFRIPNGNFPLWSDMLPEFNTIPCPWFSAINKHPVDYMKALGAGHTNTYSWAYADLVKPAVESVLEEINKHDTRVSIIAHSLGTRVALMVAQRTPKCLNRVLLLNGAEGRKQAVPIIKQNPSVKFLNVAVETDDVLRFMGSKFGTRQCIGNGMPAGMRRLENFNEVVLDDPHDQEFYKQLRGWILEGDNPDNKWDHAYSYLWKGNHPLYNAFLRGECIE